MPRLDRTAKVLIGVLKNKRDLDILLREHWYRIPVAHSPKQDFRYIAFYQPGAFGPERKRIRYYARALNRETCERCELLPNEPRHIHAKDKYFQIRVGKIRELDPPIRNYHPRRISFGFTTLPKLRTAKNILTLFDVPDTETILARALRHAHIPAVPQKTIVLDGKRFRLDFAIEMNGKKLAIECDNSKAHSGKRMHQKDMVKDRHLRRHGWKVLRFKEKDIVLNPYNCIEKIHRYDAS